MAGGREVPDAIGWGPFSSVLVECKVSRADFAADLRKVHRRAGHTMGNYRWYLTPAGLLTPDEVPDRWGLAEIQGRRVVKVKQCACDGNANWRYERGLLLSALQRLGAASVTGVSVKPYTYCETKCRATLGVLREQESCLRQLEEKP
jgi:hypothetical protein